MPASIQNACAGKPLDPAQDITRGMALASRLRLPMFPTLNLDKRIRGLLLVCRRTARSDVCVARSLRTKALKVAADQVGGRRKLRDLLGASSADLAAWISGVAEPPDEIFLRAVELILERLDARDAANKG
jgi:hypothetical protein